MHDSILSISLMVKLPWLSLPWLHLSDTMHTPLFGSHIDSSSSAYK